jgi:FkbM family methyltransferase
MEKLLETIFGPVLGKKAFQVFFRMLHKLALKGMNFGGGADYKQSGELWVFEYLKKKINRQAGVLFDVGANIGGYTLAASSVLQGWKIYAFEPAPQTFPRLQQATKELSDISLHNLGLSSQTGEASLNFGEDVTGLASLYDRDVLKNANAGKVPIKLDTIDNFCSQNNIDRINFLKLDVEGHELEALKGAKNMLDERSIDFIQFEFGGTDIDARVFLKDFFDLLENYRIARVLKDGLEFIKYEETEEIFTTTNYLAELKQ